MTCTDYVHGGHLIAYTAVDTLVAESGLIGREVIGELSVQERHAVEAQDVPDDVVIVAAVLHVERRARPAIAVLVVGAAHILHEIDES